MRIKVTPFYTQITTMPILFPINCYLVHEDTALTLVDASVERVSNKLIQYLLAQDKPLKHIIFTHNHSDHIGDIGALKKAFPDATLHMSHTDAVKISLHNVSNPENGDRIGSLEVLFTPGHTKGSISLRDIRSNDIFVGDLVQTRGGIAICGDIKFLFPFPGKATWNREISGNSFSRLSTLNPCNLLCGHGNPVAYDLRLFEKSLLKIQQKK
ncbi:MBL fold metallo-hydrolase [Erysipelothrix sp. HDW6C]|uniref:MBL fold metallo-hydrolase n=1 Tax=Erysipelothrix sp. HDW6C TaxID=2714930 RepID=UPI0014077C64|nr:MBL fold metallo-hydrolase [Erysipelothrix sp. HDW6C]QIK70314.1 MBL fold metallo-hydrolase [Erysipelothrix sp. HDW6C]